ncbi:MAG: PorV/PorQ family protein [Ignavibacteriales bacterium]|nr:PorV/PorQ family protein [Ignavibacteriales bacterium]
MKQFISFEKLNFHVIAKRFLLKSRCTGSRKAGQSRLSIHLGDCPVFWIPFNAPAIGRRDSIKRNFVARPPKAGKLLAKTHHSISQYSLILSIVATLFLCQVSTAQGTSSGSSYLKLPMNARSAALSDAMVADPGTFSSSFVNPANLATQGSYELMLSHTQWIQDVQTEFIAARLPFSFGTFGVAIGNNNVKGIELRDIPGPAIGTFSARSAFLQGSFAANVVENLNVGGTVKYLYEKIYVDEATGYGFDIGATYRTPLSGLVAGFAVTNLGSLGQLRNETSQVPSFARLGATYSFTESDFNCSAGATLANDAKQSAAHVQLGFETIYDKTFAARIGYVTGYETRGLTAGIGVHYSLVKFDYAYVPFSLGLGDAHLFSLGFQF